MNRSFAIFPLSSTDSQSILNIRKVKEYSSIIHIIAKRRLVTRDSDIIDIEFRFQRVTQDSVH